MATKDGWIDRQMPQGDEIFLDHVGYFAADLEAAGAQLERLGFQVSGINVQYNADGEGRLTPTGTSNRLIKLRRGFLEVLAATGPTPLADQLEQALGRYAGLHLIALTHPDMAAQRSRLVAEGFPMLPIVEMRRMVEVDGRAGEMAYSILRTEHGAMEEGRVQMLTTHTPELFWTPGVTEHANRADALTDLLICVADPEAAAARYARFTSRPTKGVGGYRTIPLDRGRILLGDLDTAAARLPGFDAPSAPYMAGVAVSSTDIAATRRVLSAAGIDPLIADDRIVCVGPEDALGAYLLFHAATVADPWTALEF